MSLIRNKIADRLQYEFERRNLSPGLISQKCSLDDGKISAYLQGEREIDIEEIKKICDSVNINSTRLLFSKEYPKVNLSYRNSAKAVQYFASTIEDIFLLLKGSIAPAKIEEFKRSFALNNNKKDIITEAASYSKKIKAKFNTPIDFLKSNSIPVLPQHKPDIDFDAFLIREDNKMLICVNTARVPHRINFSLAHEISHIIFDRSIDVPIDTLLTNFYWKDWLSSHEIPEYFAYKFAEFYLIPFDSAYRLAKSWPNIDLAFAQDLLNHSITTREVLANAIFDVLQTLDLDTTNDVNYSPESDHFKRMDWEEGNDIFPNQYDKLKIDFSIILKKLNNLKCNSDTIDIDNFFNESQEKIKQIIELERLNLSEEIYEYIMGTLGIEQ